MKIVCFGLVAWQKKQFRISLKNHSLRFVDGSLTDQNLTKAKTADILVVFVHSKLATSILERLPSLKLIATMSTGFDHIDTEYCKQQNIQVCNVPTYGASTVAEYTFALILSLSRKLPSTIKTIQDKHAFNTDATLCGFDLEGKTLGIIGAGNIGTHVAKIAHGFDMKVLVYDLHRDKKLSKRLGFSYVSFNKLLQASDIITLHVPYVKTTHHLINRSAINKIKKGVYLINTSRGGIIDTRALLNGLKSNKIACAALDVLENECDLKKSSNFSDSCDKRIIATNKSIMKMDNVLITPHNAFNTKEALERILDTTIENITTFMKGKGQNSVY